MQRVKRLKKHNHSNKTIDFTFFSKKGVCAIVAYRLKALPLNAVKYEMFKVTICDIGKMNINMTDKIEKRRAANCVYHIGASIKDLGKKCFGFSKMATK